MFSLKKDRGSVGALYARAYAVIGDRTPLKTDCGLLCERRCCRGDEKTGMLLFPGEETELEVVFGEKTRLALCTGNCQRDKRPLSCRIFPFFPYIDENGRISARIDPRAKRLCPLAAYSDRILFDRVFIRRVKRVGELLSRDGDCRAFMEEISRNLDCYYSLLD